ncbi:uncharacterized protein LOC62_04G005289 [Vanrija pseudolonga]|uniref:Uncharacterized protein n=1 Tax=Vanrija pseudolonga TaxID=143232 RepID=A0AAF0Y7R4_9TREE|nr:hypothetical protein LOC62_04G005289 [Vanrija pseudolonga]
MSATIDHLGFPAIVESIMHYSDFKTQLAFRATSKKYCSYVDKLHFKHALVEDDYDRDYEVSFPERALVAIPEGNYRMLYRSVEVVDVYLSGRRDHGRIKPFNSPTSIHTVRRLGWSSALAQIAVPHQVGTVVDFLRVNSYGRDRIAISSYQDRHIIHLKWTECRDRLRPHFTFTLNSPTINLKELVIVLWPEQQTSALNVPFALWSAIIDLVDYLRFWGKLKIVGLEWIAFEGVSIHCPDDFVSKFRWQLSELEDIKFEHKYDVVNAITCVTFDEWWMELGPRKAVEGLWNPLGHRRLHPAFDDDSDEDEYMDDINFYPHTSDDSHMNATYSTHSQEYDAPFNWQDAVFDEWNGLVVPNEGDVLHDDPSHGDWDAQVYEDNSEEYDWYDENYNGHCYSEEMEDMDNNWLKEIVLALHPVDAVHESCQEPMWPVVKTLIPYLRSSGRLKIVGLEKINFGNGVLTSFNNTLSTFRDELYYTLGPLAEAVEPSITCITFEQWWEELGNLKDVHGVWNPLFEVKGDLEDSIEEERDEDDESDEEYY